MLFQCSFVYLYFLQRSAVTIISFKVFFLSSLHEVFFLVVVADLLLSVYNYTYDSVTYDLARNYISIVNGFVNLARL